MGIHYTTINVTITNETGNNHDGSGSATSTPVNGKVLSVAVLYGSAQTASCDVTVATAGQNGMAAETIYTKDNSNTDVKVRPRAVVHNNAGTGVTYDGTRPIYEPFEVAGDSITVSLTGADNEAPAITVIISYEGAY